MFMDKIYILGAHVWRDGSFKETDVEISGGKVEKIGVNLGVNPKDCEVIEAQGWYLIPGLVDMHVHFREPGFSYKETIHTGSEAAAAGGFTTVCTMPNLKPSPDSLENLKKQLDIIHNDAIINVIPFATITRQRMGNELVDYSLLAPYVAGFSDDGSGVQSEEIMREAMKGIAPTGKILAAHCEVDSLLNGGYIHQGEYARLHNHKGICSESEWKEVERDIRLSEETGCRLHVCHISTKESVDLIREAKRKGLKVTCETGPHYLAFCDQDLKEDGKFKMNPPIRSIIDRDALREGIIDGTIDVIATDHAPHSNSEKSRGLEKSAMGVVGLETALAAVYTTMVKSGLISLEKFVEVMSLNARKILGLGGEKGIQEGDIADFTLVDFTKENTVNPMFFKSMGKATPFDGMRLRGEVKMTFFSGRMVYNFLN